MASTAQAAGVDLIRFRSSRHPVGRRARLMESLAIDLVIDVGANRGQFGHEIRRAGFRGRILSIEPLAEAHRHLAREAALDRQWTVVRSAAGPAAAMATMHVAANAGASSSFLPMLELHTRAAPEARYVADESVEVRTLDEVVQPHVRVSDIILTKIDVQGYELEVLAGGPVTLARSALVQLEMSLLPLYDGAPTYREVLEFMERHGFQLVGIEPGFADRTGVLLQADGVFAAGAAIRSLRAGGR